MYERNDDLQTIPNLLKAVYNIHIFQGSNEGPVIRRDVCLQIGHVYN